MVIQGGYQIFGMPKPQTLNPNDVEQADDCGFAVQQLAPSAPYSLGGPPTL